MKKRTKIIIAAFVLVAAFTGIFGANYLISVNNYQDAITNRTYTHTDATGIPDGTYTGECDVQFHRPEYH